MRQRAMTLKEADAPCKGCTKRVLRCHDTCEDYKSYKERLGQKQEYLKSYQGLFINKNYLRG